MWKWIRILAGLGLAGCGSHAPVTVASADTQANIEFTPSMQANFQGHYTSACHETYYQDMKLYGTSDETYSANQSFQQFTILSWDAACQVPFGEAQRKGNWMFFDYALSPTNPEIQTGINLNLHSSLFMPATAQVANLMDSKGFCDRADWLMGVWTPVIRGGSEALVVISAQDASMNTIFRTECSTSDPRNCVQVTLTRKE